MQTQTVKWIKSSLVAISAILIASVSVDSVVAQTEYASAREAYGAGVKLYNARKFAECREPFEAAIKLSDDNAFKVRIYRSLMQSYRQLPEIDKMLEATDFIFEHSESAVEKSLIARALTSFVHERGKTDETVKIYEAQLAEDPKSKPALYALVEIYHRASPNEARRNELLEILTAVQKQDEIELAIKFEKQAAEQPQIASAHWKDAAIAWLRADDKKQALAAVKNAEASGPDTRSELLTHFWHKGMGDAYLQLDQPKPAIAHFEAAIENTKIAGYIKECQDQIAKARALIGT